MRRSLRPLQSLARPPPHFRSRPFVTSLRRRDAISAADIQFGQPLHETHPHLVAPEELTPGISALEYHHRRAALAQNLPRNSIAVIAASDVKYRSGAVFYEFHQDASFFYLTGFNEPDALAVIEKGQSEVEYTFHLFVRPKDTKAEIWDGPRSGVQAAQDVFNADEAGDINDIQTFLPNIMSAAKEVYTDIPGNGKPNSAFSRYFARQSSKAEGFQKLLRSSTFRPLRPIMNDLRVYKSKAELRNMHRAGKISGQVFTEAMRNQHTSERELWADLAHGFKKQGLDSEAYVPVIAGGKNALSIHYVRNDCLLRDDDMVLVDAGGEYGGYVTDITRTWPIKGRFSPAQRDLYEMILKVQRGCVSMCREDADVSLDKLHRIAENGLLDGLKGLSFDMSGNALEVLFPHHLGHYIGLDVHDAPGYPRTDRLRANQCITIEPGIYVPDTNRWPKHFRGLGIRIEDSVCVAKDKPDVLTAEAVKDVDEMEALRP